MAVTELPREGTVGARSAANVRPRSLRGAFSRSHVRAAIFAALGAASGAAYAHFVGCRTGTCLITSSVWTASLYGALVGAVAGWPGRAPRGADDRGRGGSA
jgi:Family of unknown function (DUF6132)